MNALRLGQLLSVLIIPGADEPAIRPASTPESVRALYNFVEAASGNQHPKSHLNEASSVFFGVSQNFLFSSGVTLPMSWQTSQCMIVSPSILIPGAIHHTGGRDVGAPWNPARAARVNSVGPVIKVVGEPEWIGKLAERKFGERPDYSFLHLIDFLA